MNSRIPVLLILLLSGLAIPLQVAAQEEVTESPALSLHLKAEDLYLRGHFKRAYFIYVNELAAIGDKYSQYMAGYMCLHGQGTPEDRIRGSAWYRLAAERGAPEFVEVRDQVLESMSDEDRMRSDAAYVELRQKYGDLALALGHLRHERHELSSGSTGSRLTSGSSPITIVDPRTGQPMTRENYVARIEQRMQMRIDFIAEKMGIDSVDARMTDREFEDFVDQVGAFLEVIDDR